MVYLRRLFNLLLPTLRLNTITSITSNSTSSREGEEANMVGKEEMDLDMMVQRSQPLKAYPTPIVLSKALSTPSPKTSFKQPYHPVSAP